MHVTHTFEPVYNGESRVLVLGTFPSVKSRESAFYYGHPQNRFWKVTAAIVKEKVPVSIEEKKSMLLKHGIAIWDVISSCDIKGSSDSSIKSVVPNDVGGLLGKSKIITTNSVKKKQGLRLSNCLLPARPMRRFL